MFKLRSKLSAQFSTSRPSSRLGPEVAKRNAITTSPLPSPPIMSTKGDGSRKKILRVGVIGLGEIAQVENCPTTEIGP
jgi:hypothetical protein